MKRIIEDQNRIQSQGGADLSALIIGGGGHGFVGRPWDAGAGIFCDRVRELDAVPRMTPGSQRVRRDVRAARCVRRSVRRVARAR